MTSSQRRAPEVLQQVTATSAEVADEEAAVTVYRITGMRERFRQDVIRVVNFGGWFFEGKRRFCIKKHHG